MTIEEKISKAKQPFVNIIFDKAKHAISKMGKDTYTIVLYFYEFNGNWFVELRYNTEVRFRKYFNRELKNIKQFASWQTEYGMTWEEYVKGITSVGWYFTEREYGDEELNWRCKELGEYDGNIPEKYFREIVTEVKDCILAENVLAEKFGKNIPFFVTDKESLDLTKEMEIETTINNNNGLKAQNQ
jgi:hypothetical protein